VRKRNRKKFRMFRKPLAPATRPNQRWSLDFVSDSLSNGRRYRKLAVERLTDCILNRFSRSNEIEENIPLSRPGQHRIARELRAVIENQPVRLPMAPNQLVKKTGYALA
jgi:putative transposase